MSPRSHDMLYQVSQTAAKKWLLLQYWIPVLIYCSIIVYLSSLSYPSHSLPSFLLKLPLPTFLLNISDKLIHGVEYGILGILLYRAFHQSHRTITSISLAVICALAFGISDEFHQWFVPHRQADIWDVFADTIGATLFVFVWVLITKKYASFHQLLND